MPLHTRAQLAYAEDMANTPNVDEAVELARQAQEDRIEAVKKLAESRQTVADAKEALAQAEAEDLKAWNHAVGLGWPEAELKKIGFKEPDKKRRTKRQPPARERSRSGSPGNQNGSTPEASNGTQEQPAAAPESSPSY